MSQRDNTFDVMKGIGILAMVVGHSPIPTLLYDFIFVWHIPLFFIVSGYFYKPKPVWTYVQKNGKQLIIPYVATSTVMILLCAIRQLTLGVGDTINMLIAALVGNGTVNNPTFSEFSIGAIWFLLAIFWCRSLYNVLCVRIVNPLCLFGWILTLSIIATFIGSMIYLPTDVLEGVGALLFFYIGHLARSYRLLEIKPNWLFYVVVMLLTILSIFSGSMSMVRCFYGYWPINYLAAIGMTFVVFQFSHGIFKNSFLSWCGRMSIVILCVHIIIITFFPFNKVHESLGVPCQIDVLINVITALVGAWVILRLQLIRNLFQIR